MDSQISLEEHFVASMSVNSLRKYKKHYKLSCPANSRKNLSAAVAQHFKNQLIVDHGANQQASKWGENTVVLQEREVLSTFISTVKSSNSKME